MALGIGDRLGPYEIVMPIGAGGMGEVYKARNTRLDREVAIKVRQPSVRNAVLGSAPPHELPSAATTRLLGSPPAGTRQVDGAVEPRLRTGLM
jgi:serine/threonine protein kinase